MIGNFFSHQINFHKKFVLNRHSSLEMKCTRLALVESPATPPVKPANSHVPPGVLLEAFAMTPQERSPTLRPRGNPGPPSPAHSFQVRINEPEMQDPIELLLLQSQPKKLSSAGEPPSPCGTALAPLRLPRFATCAACSAHTHGGHECAGVGRV